MFDCLRSLRFDTRTPRGTGVWLRVVASNPNGLNHLGASLRLVDESGAVPTARVQNLQFGWGPVGEKKKESEPRCQKVKAGRIRSRVVARAYLVGLELESIIREVDHETSIDQEEPVHKE